MKHQIYLDSIDAVEMEQSMSPIEFGNFREANLKLGLQALAQELDCQLKPIGIMTARGEFLIAAADPKNPSASWCGQFGESFAALLSLVPWRTGQIAIESEVLPENGWLYINHFDCEKLLRMAIAIHNAFGPPAYENKTA